jgi:hypothetical protein
MIVIESYLADIYIDTSKHTKSVKIQRPRWVACHYYPRSNVTTSRRTALIKEDDACTAQVGQIGCVSSSLNIIFSFNLFTWCLHNLGVIQYLLDLSKGAQCRVFAIESFRSIAPQRGRLQPSWPNRLITIQPTESLPTAKPPTEYPHPTLPHPS